MQQHNIGYLSMSSITVIFPKGNISSKSDYKQLPHEKNVAEIWRFL